MKRKTTIIKEKMGKNTTKFITGKISKKKYLSVDDHLHDDLFKVMKTK